MEVNRVYVSTGQQGDVSPEKSKRVKFPGDLWDISIRELLGCSIRSIGLTREISFAFQF